MKFSITTYKLKYYLEKLCHIPNDKNNITPEQSGILIKANNNKLSFLASNELVDLKIETTNQENIKIEENGEILIKSKLLRDVISKITDQRVNFTQVEDNIVLIHSEKKEYEINLINGTMEVNVFTDVDEEKIINIPSLYFVKGMNSIINAINERNTRKILTGVNIISNIEENKILFYATDGSRASRYSIDVEITEKINTTINIRAIKDLLNIIEPSEENLKIYTNNRKVVLQSKEITIQADIMNIEYPQIEKIFKEDFNKEINISKIALRDLIDSVSVISSTNTLEYISTKLSIEQGVMQAVTKESEIGTAKAKTKKFNSNFDELFVISFNPKYLHETLKYIHEQEILMLFNGPSERFMIKGKAQNNFKTIILPYRVMN